MQIGLSTTCDLSPWLGGGFGMFATIDSRDDRHLVARVLSPGLTRELLIPDDLRDRASRVRAFPTEARMRSLAQELLDREAERIPGVQGIRLELWHVKRETGTLAPTDSLTRTVRVEVGTLDD